MSSKFQTALLIGIAFVMVMLYMRRPEKQIPIVQDIKVTQPEEKTIIVSGDGKLITKLDTAEFIIAYDTEETDLAIAKEKSEEMYAEATDILKSHGIEERDIIFDYSRVEAKTGYTTAVNRKPYGPYVVHTTIKVTVRHLEELEPLFIDLQEAGFYQIEDIVLRISNLDDIRNRVYQLAIDAADKKAKAIVRAIKLEIEYVISIDTLESNNSYSSYENYYASLDDFFGTFDSGWRRPSYSGPDITILAHVTVKYELK